MAMASNTAMLAAVEAAALAVAQATMLAATKFACCLSLKRSWPAYTNILVYRGIIININTGIKLSIPPSFTFNYA